MKIKSEKLDLIGVMPEFDEIAVKNEPMLFNCDMAHANQLGGPIVKALIQRIPLDWHEEPLVIDTRVHMLMPGWYPCIPGWHHDDVPRTREDKQPNYGPDQDRSVHCVALVNGGICPTGVALGEANFTDVPLGDVIYKQWHKEVENYLYEQQFKYTEITGNQIVVIDDRTWHKGSSANRGGWRWFGRISRYFDKFGNCIARRNKRTNEVRRQVQVYLEPINRGW